MRLGLGGHDEGGELAEGRALLPDVVDALARVGATVRARAGVGVRVRRVGVRVRGHGAAGEVTVAHAQALAVHHLLRDRVSLYTTCLGIGLACTPPA